MDKRKRSFYLRLAGSNIRKNSRFYLPYLLTGAAVTAMFYIMMFLSQHPCLGEIFGGDTLRIFLRFGIIIIGLFATVILFYTNSFLMKRRRRELGLFCVLGMEKRHLARIQWWETVISYILTLAGGLVLGVLFSGAVMKLLGRIAGFDAPFSFSFDTGGALLTAIVFALIYLLILLANLLRVGRAKPIALLHSEQVGQKEPRTRHFLAVLGFLTLAGGYAIALLVESPIQAVFLFFIAVLLVIIGTYCLFTAGSIAILKALRRNKKYYYHPRHFTNVSGMLYRMKQNAVGLANICILSTMVLVTVSTTVSLYAGIEGTLQNMTPHEIMAQMNREEGGSLEELPQKAQLAADLAADENLPLKAYGYYQTLEFNCYEEDGNFVPAESLYDYKGVTMCFVTAADYNKESGNQLQLASGEVAISGWHGGSSVQILGRSYPVAGALDSALPMGRAYAGSTARVYLVAVADTSMLDQLAADASGAYDMFSDIGSYIWLDTDGTSAAEQAAFTQKLDEVLCDSDNNCWAWTYCRADLAGDAYALYGGFLFLGVFLGLLFLLATILIMYYKQITEGYEDARRFHIMQQVGMSKAEVRATIRSQVLTVFFLPLLLAAIHVAFAFSIITKLLAALYLTDVGLFALVTVITFAVFALVYIIVYSLTARTYYRIVSQ